MRKLFKIFALVAVVSICAISCQKSEEASSFEGVGSIDSPYTISTAAELRQLATGVNNGTSYVGETFTLTADIELDGMLNEFTAIGTYSNPFCGTFDGGGHTISGLYINQTDLECQALFGCTYSATITNLNVEGVVVGHAYVGGIVGYASNSEISYCNNDVDVSGYAYIGGVIGAATNTINEELFTSKATDDVFIAHCTNSGDVLCLEKYYTGCYVGGIVGESTIAINNCSNSGSIESVNYGVAAGIVGRYSIQTGYSTQADLYNCSNTGEISSPYKNVTLGGIVGTFYYEDERCYQSSIYDCCNNGSVTGYDISGGIVGAVNVTNLNKSYAIYNSYNEATITGSYGGGIVGYFNSSNTVEPFVIYDCYNNGDISTYYYGGGIAGYANYSTIYNCYNVGDVSADSIAGGLLGYVKYATISSSYSVSEVTADSYTGGLIGLLESTTVNYCYSNSDYSSKNESLTIGSSSDIYGSNISLKSLDEMKSVDFVSLMNSETFDTQWDFDLLKINNGLPILNWQN